MLPHSDQSPNHLELSGHLKWVSLCEGRQKLTLPALPKAEMRTDYVFMMYKCRHSLTLVSHRVTGAPWYIYGTCAYARAPPEIPVRSARNASSRGHNRGLAAGQ